jgi:excisionase family DNA binding protein
MMPSVLLPTTEAASRLHMSPRTLERMRSEGTGPAYIKAGRRVLYAEEQLAAWLNERIVSSTAEARALRLQGRR